uniref:Uncharacterized protein LOC110203696 isoform X1 n=1 Tax=Phascolarctos cinereus TaxID=38626 RepID=A0A6P5JNG5_PHACI|nr:uncharacterized protein LOC110203696 isoform X1 [Phascolarctos cinereus]
MPAVFPLRRRKARLFCLLLDLKSVSLPRSRERSAPLDLSSVLADSRPTSCLGREEKDLTLLGSISLPSSVCRVPRPGPSREPGARGNGPWEQQPPSSGVGDIQGCGCGLHPGGVGPLGPSSEGVVQGSHAGECPEPALPRASSSQRRCDVLF